MSGPFDRAWSRRPFASPARWMPEASVPALWAETLVEFSRSGSVATPGGGFDRGRGSPVFLTAYCHAEIAQATTPSAQSDGAALVISQWWSIFCPLIVDDVPIDPANYPAKGDHVRFTDDLGRTIEMDIRAVTSPDTVHSHLEIDTEEFG